MEWLSSGSAILAVIGGVIGFVGLFGGAAGYYKASRGDSIIKYQTIEIEGLRRKDADNEKENLELKSEIKTLQATIDAKDNAIVDQEKQIVFLQKMSQGSPQLEKLTSAIENQTKIFTEYFQRRDT